MNNLSTFEKTTSIETEFNSDHQLVLYPGNVHDLLLTLPDHSITLVVTSPPYNLGKNYEKRISIENYLQQQEPIIEQLARVLKSNGSICWQVGNYVEKGEVFPLDIFYYQIFKKYNFLLRNRIIWHFGHGLHAQSRFSGRYETILWFTKSKDYIFNLDAVRVPSKYPGKRHYKGKNKGKPSGNPNGKNPSDLWQIALEEWSKEVWEIPNVKSNHPEKTIHPCQYPVELVERCVLALTNENDWVFDPFAGVGSSLIAALKHNRKAIGCEKEPQYVEIATERIKAYFNGTLVTRPMGKPVYQPTGKEKISQVPDEWKM
ncbi:DNA methylase N-4/N-6 domain protein [Stanieria cyanosphaera PCC 7437]|uniref:Methyltransferase n=1 Tax=Stanieria cyanosphaera (strain ATCC 29371 / PCC 7437) TaxID=111780 RepID=K9XZA6_STAC7|nr:site-specific DNA-methyltransferase [Stanieria cyanosphaera]AFZ37858.1 DNA methylase N-4/N-6 domain protein [Stanieria cyanosphaera PCC 7437]